MLLLTGAATLRLGARSGSGRRTNGSSSSKQGHNVYAFGCRTVHASFPTKDRICRELKDRIFWIPWGGTPFDWEQVLAATPVMHNLKPAAVFVGSKWGVPGRGNVEPWTKYLEPLRPVTYGRGTPSGPLSDEDMVATLQKHALCPIIHAAGWQAEEGIQDRFYTVFLSGRFGVCDNVGAKHFFGDDAVCETDPKRYVALSKHYQTHVKEQKR